MLTDFQRRIAHVLAEGRSTASYVAGGAALNERWPRLSDDIDIFHDDERKAQSCAAADIEILKATGLEVELLVDFPGFIEAAVSDAEGSCRLQWIWESTRRFLPIVPHPIFGWVMQPADLAVNKLVAAASRRTARDYIDLVSIQHSGIPIAVLAWAAVEKLPGMGPEKILDEVLRRAMAHPSGLYASIALNAGDPLEMIAELPDIVEEARNQCRRLPVETLGNLFLDRNNRPADPSVVEATPHPIAEYGTWPVFPDQDDFDWSSRP